MASQKTRSRDRSSLRHYRIELPNMIDDLGLSVYAFRLYVHLKRVAEDEGSCWQSARTLATACNMSSGQVSKAKDELEAQGLITRHIKMVRGGIGDDITIVDIWPRNFERYAPESDHHTITSDAKAITTRSLTETDHYTITSLESDHLVIAETIKRSPGDPKNHDQYHIENQYVVGVGDRAGLFVELRRRKISRAKAEALCTIAATDADILTSIDNLYDPSNPQTMGGAIELLLDAPPEEGKPYERQPRPIQPDHAPDQPRRSQSRARGTHNGTGGAEIRDPGWMERAIAEAEARARSDV